MTKRIKAFFRKKGADKPIFFAVFVLICLGIVMIGSASIGAVSSKGTAFAIKNMITQSIYVAIGVFIMMVLTKGFKLKMINNKKTTKTIANQLHPVLLQPKPPIIGV